MAKTGKLSAHMLAIRSAAARALETITGSSYKECAEYADQRRSQFAMNDRFDMWDEQHLVHGAFRIYELCDDITGYNDSMHAARLKLFDPGKKELLPALRTTEHSTATLLRQLDVEILKFNGALRACRRQTRDCMEEAEGREKKQLRRFSEALKALGEQAQVMDENLSGIQEAVHFRSSAGR